MIHLEAGWASVHQNIESTDLLARRAEAIEIILETLPRSSNFGELPNPVEPSEHHILVTPGDIVIDCRHR